MYEEVNQEEENAMRAETMTTQGEQHLRAPLSCLLSDLEAWINEASAPEALELAEMLPLVALQARLAGGVSREEALASLADSARIQCTDSPEVDCAVGFRLGLAVGVRLAKEQGST